MLVGYPLIEVPIIVDKILMKEIDIRSMHRYANVFPTAIKLVWWMFRSPSEEKERKITKKVRGLNQSSQ